MVAEVITERPHNLQHCYQMELVNESHGDPVIFSAVLSLHLRNLKALWIPQVSSENVPSKKITSSQLQQGKETVLNYKKSVTKIPFLWCEIKPNVP